MSTPAQTPDRLDHVSVSAKSGNGLIARIDQADPRLIDAVILAALVVAGTSLYTVYALRIGSFQPDEWYYMEVARAIAQHFPAGLWQKGVYWRGVQRLDQLILAAPFAFLRGASVYEAAHVIQALLYASTAIPVWLLGLAAGLRRWSRALAATIVLAAPWAIVSTSFLAESAAYPAYAWALYATWLVATRPTRTLEMLAIAALMVAALSRTALLAMAPILPVAVLWQQWGFELREKRWRSRLRALPARLWSRQPIVTGITSVALAVFLLNAVGLLPGGGLAALTGNYGLPTHNALTGLLERYDYYLSRVIVGTGGIAMVLGFAWALRAVFRPRDGAAHALAVVSVLGIAVMLLSLVQAGPDERYVLYGAVPVALTFAAELDLHWRRRHERGLSARELVISYLLAAAVVIALFDIASWPLALGEYEFFTYPAETFYARVVLTRLTTLPAHLTPSDLVDGVIVIFTLVWVLIVRRRRTARVAVVVAGMLVLALCSVELVYSLDKFTKAPAATADGVNAAQRSWLERAVAPHVHVAVVGIGLGASPGYVPIWRTAEFWNPSAVAGLAFASWEVPTLPFDGEARVVAVDSPSGRLRITSPTSAEAGHPLFVPHYLLLPRQGTNPDGFVAKPVAADPLLPLELVRLEGMPRLEWSLAGTSDEGFMAPGKPASATVYESALRAGPRCASLDLIAPATYSGPAFAGSWPYTVSSAGNVVRGRLRGGQTRSIQILLRPIKVAGGEIATVTIHVKGEAKFITGAYVSARVAFFSVGACGRGG
jgi:hypothetical protein